MSKYSPAVIFIFSGKRKSGKDYVTEILKERIGAEQCTILRLSAPLKGQYAKEHGLDFDKLLDASEYKEKYRVDMIRWGEEKRNRDPGFFCHLVATGPGSDHPAWVISDARRKTDVKYFQEHYGTRVVTVRVQADDAVRVARGWVFKEGVDDAESECGLDAGVAFDVLVTNNGDEAQLETALEGLVQMANTRLSAAASL